MASGPTVNCRTVSPDAWEHARQALVFYFSRRHGLSEAEDLAQDTLAAVLARDDFVFEKEEDFLKVCYGFANRINLEAYRGVAKHVAAALDFDPPAAQAETQGLRDAELRVYLHEVLNLGKERLRARDWEILKRATSEEGKRIAEEFGLGDVNNARVYLHRLRKKLAGWTGWRKERL
jgi:DNA-directed RNA polymerase specialized sigma24 family protein